MTDKKKQVFDSIWDMLEPDEKNVVVTEHLKSISKWDFKRILCDVMGVEHYMDDNGLREAVNKLINVR